MTEAIRNKSPCLRRENQRNNSRHLRALLQADADIIPEPESGILRIRILGTASNAGDNAIAELLDELNQTRTLFPETKLRMVFELPENQIDTKLSGSTI